MQASISYHTINGKIRSATYEPYTRSEALLTDALGSVVRTKDDYGGADFRYYAYGGLIKATPGYLTPYIGWVGSLGYRETNLNHAEQYIRARHYSSTEARWTTVDPLWPRQPAYGYAAGRPASFEDFDGEQMGKRGKKPDPCAPGGDNRRHPTNNCSKCGPGCKPVYFTCNQSTNRQLAVYCNSDRQLGMGCNYQTFCQYNKCCPGPKDKPVRPPLGPPVFPFGSKVCIHGLNGTHSRKIDDCGCGQRAGNIPMPNNWMDFETKSCHGFKDGWRCVCPGECK